LLVGISRFCTDVALFAAVYLWLAYERVHIIFVNFILFKLLFSLFRPTGTILTKCCTIWYVLLTRVIWHNTSL